MDQFARTSMLLGPDKIKRLNNITVAIFGLGGVGSYVAEGLSRCGIGNFILIDNDTVDITNLNRQIIALHSTIGQDKVEVANTRILDINPNANVITHKIFYPSENSKHILNNCDYVVDAIDTITSKLSLIEDCSEKSIPIISSMGTGNKLNPTLFEVSDISKTSVCPMCRIMRHELKKRNITSLKVVYSKEAAQKPDKLIEVVDIQTSQKRQTPGSISFVPSVAGLIIASEVIKDIISK